MAKTGPKKLSEWHQQLLDYLLANPRATLQDCAAHFDVTVPWLSQVKNSDAFKAVYEERRHEISSGVTATVVERATTALEIGLDVVAERLDANRHTVDLHRVNESIERAAGILGYNRPAAGPTQQVNLNIGLVEPEVLAEARALHRERLQHQPSPELALVTESLQHGQPVDNLPEVADAEPIAGSTAD